MSSTMQDYYRTGPDYAHRAVATIASVWNRARGNHSGTRAAFRRWRPDADGEPTMEMRSIVWGYLGDPFAEPEMPADAEAPADGALSAGQPAVESVGSSYDPRSGRIVNHAAVLVALRAAAGDHEGAPLSFGAALHAVDIGDMRFMRLMTTRHALRTESLMRAMMRIDRARKPIAWNKKLCDQLYAFLFGTQEAAQRSITAWGQEYFQARGRTATVPDELPADAAATTTSNN